MVPTVVPTSPETLKNAVSAQPVDAILSEITAAWPRLPAAIKTAIHTLVQAAGITNTSSYLAKAGTAKRHITGGGNA